MDHKYIRGIKYSDHSSLNTLQICIPSGNEVSDDKSKIWVIFLHGGAWRDPAKLENIFDKSTQLILDSSIKDSVAAVASIGYRLSPHPTHPLQPKDPKDPSRNAHHPDHINDILDGIAFLQQKYSFGDRYVLAGHSAGATLAFQVCMSRTWNQVPSPSTTPPQKSTIPPIAVLGLEGIYDIPELIAYHKTRPYYEIYDAFTHSAFGRRVQLLGESEVDVWSAASPTTGLYLHTWKNGRLVILAHSHEDELVEWEQMELIDKALEKQGWGTGGKNLSILELRGKHDQVVDEGVEVARAVIETIKKVLTL